MFTPTTLLSLGLFAAAAHAHGYPAGFRINGQWNPGYNPGCTDGSAKDCPPTAGWTITNKKWGPVLPPDYANPAIICNYDAHPAALSAEAPAGAHVDLTWNTWPPGHTGPIITALAACNGSCSTVDPTELSFAPFDQKGIISGTNPGKGATDTMLTNNKTYSVQLPANLKAGDYVLRTEIVALFASEGSGTQNYPYCINLHVTGDGTAVPTGGKPAMDWYKQKDPGLWVNMYTDGWTAQTYPMPGPKLWDASKEQSGVAATPATGGSSSTPMPTVPALPSSAAAQPQPTSSAALRPHHGTPPTYGGGSRAVQSPVASSALPAPFVQPQAVPSALPEPAPSAQPESTPAAQPSAAPAPVAQPESSAAPQPSAAPATQPEPAHAANPAPAPAAAQPFVLKPMPEGTTKADLLAWLAIALGKIDGDDL